jgi:hypothetical protein
MSSTQTTTIQSGNVVARFEDVGPARAKELLDTYKVDYRKLRPTYRDGLTRDMVNGHWNFDGSPIRIDEEGNLFDGQHRLSAVEQSGTTQRFLIVYGLPVEAYNTTDTGLARTYNDTLRRRGYQNVSQRGALVKLIHRWNTGRSLDDTTRMTASEMDDIHDRYVDSISRAVQLSVSTARKICLPGALVSFSWWLLSRVDSERAYTFLVSVAEGENLRHGQPAYTLRERLRMDIEQRYTRNEYMHLVISAWNAYVENREITRLILPRGIMTRDRMARPNGAPDSARSLPAHS